MPPPLRERCGARRDIGASSFTGVGRGGLPPSPDGPLASAYVTGAVRGRRGGGDGGTRPADRRSLHGIDVRLAGLSAPLRLWIEPMHRRHARRLPAWPSAAALPAWADVVTDGTAGPRVRLDGPDFEIGADLGTRAGRNLFHSFERFSLDAGERATFSGPDAIRNVISRVTGGERSDIDGTIRSTIPGADFYFLNPAGVLFGPNASLDVQGSFHVSTADELRFADGAMFSARDPAASSFTVAAPEAFGFLGAAPGADRGRPQHARGAARARRFRSSAATST